MNVTLRIALALPAIVNVDILIPSRLHSIGGHCIAYHVFHPSGGEAASDGRCAFALAASRIIIKPILRT